ncbi:unnamed protein product, partial [Lymnaea stagnalis]
PTDEDEDGGEDSYVSLEMEVICEEGVDTSHSGDKEDLEILTPGEAEHNRDTESSPSEVSNQASENRSSFKTLKLQTSITKPIQPGEDTEGESGVHQQKSRKVPSILSHPKAPKQPSASGKKKTSLLTSVNHHCLKAAQTSTTPVITSAGNGATNPSTVPNPAASSKALNRSHKTKAGGGASSVIRHVLTQSDPPPVSVIVASSKTNTPICVNSLVNITDRDCAVGGARASSHTNLAPTPGSAFVANADVTLYGTESSQNRRSQASRFQELLQQVSKINTMISTEMTSLIKVAQDMSDEALSKHASSSGTTAEVEKTTDMYEKKLEDMSNSASKCIPF